MKPTIESLAAYSLGYNMQMLNWKAFQDDYAECKADMAQSLKEMDFDLDLPTDLDAFVSERDAITDAIVKHLMQKRAQLGGDCYSLTMYYFGYVPLELVLSAAWKSENYETMLWMLKGILDDFGIQGEYDALRHVLDVETEWLAQQSSLQDGNVEVKDALNASLRLISRVGALWKAAEKLDSPVNFAQVPYHSVFISYSTVDEEFGKKLHDALAAAGIRVWFAPHDIQPGKKIHQQLYKAIEEFDKLLLVLSDASMKSEWVGTELYKARERERKQGVQMLFPVRLVPFEKVKDWSAFDADGGRDLAREIREYFIPDFSDWKNDEAFTREVGRIVKALMVVEVPPESAVPAAVDPIDK